MVRKESSTKLFFAKNICFAKSLGNKRTTLTLSTILKNSTYISTMLKGQKKSELILYAVLWAILFAAPVLSMYIGDIFTSSSSEVSSGAADVSFAVTSEDWQGVFNAWGLLSMFFVTFAIHNFFVAPLLVFRNRKWAYGICVFVLFACFVTYQMLGRPHRPEPRGERGRKPNMEKPMEKPNERMEAPPMRERRPKPMGHEADFRPAPPEKPMMQEGDRRDGPKDRKHEPPRAFGGQDSVAFIIMALLLGLNIGTKYFFKSLDDRKKMKELERENLNRQLEYLKYQINPHFFMNTLNNIHALVDIDPEQAKYTIEVLSKLMRYVLYEGNKTMAPLSKELDFIRHYVDLMRIRYTDKVRITVSLPETVADIQVPSLLFTTFVENAFKHGVSYQQESFIEVSVRVNEVSREIEFLCGNSKKPASEDKHGGVGLRNAIKRLQLIYGKDGYEMSVDDKEDEYRMVLRLPFNVDVDGSKIRLSVDS